VPSFLYKTNPLAKFGYNLKADRFISWQAQIKDVCSRCNNDLLSKVDAYANRFFMDNRIDRMVTREKRIEISYEFSWLCRVLQKITFNCLRFKGQDTDWLTPFSDFILYGADYPANLGVKLGVEVTPCHKITESERILLPEESKAWEYIPPHLIRIGQTSGLPSKRILGRYVFINNFCFHVLIFQRPIGAREFRNARAHFSTACPDVTWLDFHGKSATIRVSSTDTLARYADTATGLINKWADYLNGNG
jgi:hypothetical protein